MRSRARHWLMGALWAACLAVPAAADRLDDDLDLIRRCLAETLALDDFVATLLPLGLDAAPPARGAEAARGLAVTALAGAGARPDRLAAALADRTENARRQLALSPGRHGEGAVVLARPGRPGFTLVTWGRSVRGPVSCDLFVGTVSELDDIALAIGVLPRGDSAVPETAIAELDIGPHAGEASDTPRRITLRRTLPGHLMLYGHRIASAGHVSIRRRP